MRLILGRCGLDIAQYMGNVPAEDGGVRLVGLEGLKTLNLKKKIKVQRL